MVAGERLQILLPISKVCRSLSTRRPFMKLQDIMWFYSVAPGKYCSSTVFVNYTGFYSIRSFMEDESDVRILYKYN
jgi:hypothetical protein